MYTFSAFVQMTALTMRYSHASLYDVKKSILE
jgi:hypothetical protein